MTVAVKLASSLSDYCHGVCEFEIVASNVAEALAQIEQAHPEVYRSVCNESGVVRQHVHLFVNQDFIPARSTQGLQTRLRAGDLLTIWPAVSGG